MRGEARRKVPADGTGAEDYDSQSAPIDETLFTASSRSSRKRRGP
jgi:hypothetical protein